MDLLMEKKDEEQKPTYHKGGNRTHSLRNMNIVFYHVATTADLSVNLPA